MISKLCLVAFCLFVFTLSSGFVMGKREHPLLKITEVESCQNEENYVNTFEITLNNIDSDGWKALDMYADIKKPIDGKFRYIVGLEKRDSGDWQKGLYNQEGKLCDLINRFAKKAWEKLTKQIEPNIKDMYVNQGQYNLKDFEVTKDEIVVGMMPGTLRVTLRAFNDENEIVLCGIVIAEVVAVM